jgi:hypothetical protein
VLAGTGLPRESRVAILLPGVAVHVAFVAAELTDDLIDRAYGPDDVFLITPRRAPPACPSASCTPRTGGGRFDADDVIRAIERERVTVLACVSTQSLMMLESRATRVGTDLDLDALGAFLRERGVSPEWFPERLVVVDALPRASGGKVAKGELRADLRRRMDAGR